MTCVGVEESSTPGTVTNGVLVPLPSSETLKTFDHRERHYIRRQVSLEDIEVFHSHSHEFDAQDRVWVYMLQNDEPTREGAPKLPSKELPIAQSYVDVCLSGFLQFGVEFAREFVKESSHWQSLEDDRSDPKIYSKGYVPQGTLSIIDSLLRSTLPHLFGGESASQMTLPRLSTTGPRSSIYWQSAPLARNFSTQPAYPVSTTDPVSMMASPARGLTWHRPTYSPLTALNQRFASKAVHMGSRALRRL